MDGNRAAGLRAELGALAGAVALVLLAGVGLGNPADRPDRARAAGPTTLAADVTPRAPTAGDAAAAATDITAPIAVATTNPPNPDGWYREPTTYSWTAVDPESGISRCQRGFVEARDSAVPRTVYGGCTNGAGLASTYTGFSYRYDGTPPTLSPVVEPSVVPRHGTVVARAGAADALSGLQSQGCVIGRGLGTRTLGLHTITCTATDRAGNRAWAAVSYRVVQRRS